MFPILAVGGIYPDGGVLGFRLYFSYKLSNFDTVSSQHAVFYGSANAVRERRCGNPMEFFQGFDLCTGRKEDGNTKSKRHGGHHDYRYLGNEMSTYER
jgi:hypothetical protein